MKNFLAIILAMLCGCGLSQPHFEPNDSTDWPDQTGSSAIVVMVSEPWCSVCRDQEDVLRKLERDGLIARFEIVNSRHPEYRAKTLPTLYICRDSGCVKLEGLSTEQQILQAARD